MIGKIAHHTESHESSELQTAVSAAQSQDDMNMGHAQESNTIGFIFMGLMAVIVISIAASVFVYNYRSGKVEQLPKDKRH